MGDLVVPPSKESGSPAFAPWAHFLACCWESARRRDGIGLAFFHAHCAQHGAQRAHHRQHFRSMLSVLSTGRLSMLSMLIVLMILIKLSRLSMPIVCSLCSASSLAQCAQREMPSSTQSPQRRFRGPRIACVLSVVEI